MAWIATLTLPLAITISLTSAEDPEALNVIYPRATMTPALGSSVKLICMAVYDPKRCGQVHAVWSRLEQDSQLTDPDKYLTTVNETITEDNMRRRQVLTEILNINSKDKGGYQCKAECSKSGDAVMGHLITLKLTA